MPRFSLIAAVPLVFLYLIAGFPQIRSQKNSPPEVKIIAPTTNSTFSWSSLIPYTIHVSDREDGNSEYDEINPTEVVLIVKYLSSSSELKSSLYEESKTDYSSLVQMGRSTCFTCHKAKGKLTGPSFKEIAAKYQNEPNAVEFLTDKVIKGGTLVWSDQKMPPHPDLKLAQVTEMVRWILENNSNPTKNYLVGIEGSIKTMEKPEGAQEENVLVLTAQYTDQGSDKTPYQSKRGQNTLPLKSKK